VQPHHRRDDVVAIPIGALRRVILTVAVLGILVLIGAIVWQQRDRLLPAASDPFDESAYQAVFLVTDQVYFGKLRIDGDRYLLSDVYYVSQPGGGAQGQLVKRGTELHAPRDPMIIPARSVLFIENMREDSEVSVAIRQLRSGQGSPTAPAATAAPSPTVRPSPTASR
jgi:hypothetical protein